MPQKYGKIRRVIVANKLEKWMTHRFSSSGCAGKDYLAFQREARTDLKKQALAAGYGLSQFNKGHYCFSAVLQDEETGDFVYVSVSDVRFSPGWYSNVLYRAMAHEKDWTGGPNRYCRWDGLSMALTEMKIRRAS